MKVTKIKRHFAFHRLLIYIVSCFFVLIIAANLIIVIVSSKYIYTDIEEIPPEKAALVLGTSSHMRSGSPNPFFHHRMSAAAELYHSGRVQHLILSGDNRTRYYNEPERMRTELLKYEVPDSVMYLDYAGLRTLDSVIRCYEIFGQESFIVVSQKFHNQRAIFLARAHGIQAIGYNATDVDSQSGVRTYTREYFARVKAFMDLITRKGPRHLGDPVDVGDKKTRI
jgi:SanA protein